MNELKKIFDIDYFAITGEDIIETAIEMGIKEEEIKPEDVEWVANKMTDGMDWWTPCRLAWEIWKEKNTGTNG